VVRVRGEWRLAGALTRRRPMHYRDVALAVWPGCAARVARRNTTREGGGAATEGLRGWDTVSGEVAGSGALGWLGERVSS
jgi:hypothetical protein